MSKPEYTELELQQTARRSEGSLDRATLNSLSDARARAVSSQNKWFGEFRGLFSAGIVTTALVVLVLLPLSINDSPTNSQNVDIADENLRLLMEDPEFFLWVSSSYSALSQ